MASLRPLVPIRNGSSALGKVGPIILPGGSDVLWDLYGRLVDKFLPTGGPGDALSILPPQDPVRDLPFVPQFIDRFLSGTMPRGARAPITNEQTGRMECPQGYHFHKGGQPYCVRNRRMNPLNPRALNRASRRIGGFARAVKRARTLKRVVKNL